MKLLKNKNIILILPLLILNAISLLNMINSKYISSTYSNAFYKQFIWIILGYIIIIILNKIKVKNIFRISKYLYIFSNLLLFLVLIIGKDINGAKCWINIFGISFEPSELMKISLAFFLINIADNSKIKTTKDELLLLIKLIILTLIPCILVFLEPDTGAIINYLIILLIIIFNIKINKKWHISIIMLSIIFITLLILLTIFNKDFLVKILGTSLFYRIDRIINFSNGSSYQLENALITIGNSKFFNFNLGSSIIYIPEAPTDFVFSFTIGNYGLFSGLLILLSFLIIDLYLIFNNYKVNNKKYKLFIKVYLGIFIFQQLYNILMNIGLLPIMGIPLTFVSYGGTNTIINYLFLGIIINMLKNKGIHN